MSIALLGVVAMQYYFIRETYKQKSNLFDEAINTSLAKVASEIEKSELINNSEIITRANQAKHEAEQKKQLMLAEQLRIQKKIELLSLRQYETFQKFKDLEENLKTNFQNATEIENWFYETYFRKKENRKYIEIKLKGRPVGTSSLVDLFVEVSATEVVKRVNAVDDSVRFVVSDIDINTRYAREYSVATLPPRADASIVSELRDLRFQLDKLHKESLANAKNAFDTLAALGGKKSGVVEDFALSIQLSNRPLEKRVNQSQVQKLLQEELISRGIYSPFNIEIRDRSRIIYHSPDAETLAASNKSPRYTTALFKGDFGESTGRLSIYFPNKKRVIVDNMSYLILPTLALFAVLIGCFAYTLSIIFKQKKISEMKTDFINNMTHEFKTPVATIMIASESLRDPEIASNEQRVNKLANIIYDENVRLGSHIERVLNIAKLEKENLRMERTDVRVNALIEGVLDSMHLQLNKANGVLQTELLATRDLIIGDELHLSNVFFNLVDNAIKYSPNPPDIQVKTYNSKGNIVISISDKGMGMNKEQQEKIFDQFYRIPTGNLHNVKGFGLGLSYVHDIVKRLDGKIQVKSEKDKGTTFEITLPLKTGEPNN
ncbi:two-component system, OmpR family, phosphate regulon sensor histidine kinase PhoR [Sphingobacterium nematocida]|uniref:histidine kinase n=2 Tax=Sphingobacterium nematocida TaxID=1513896 RepID=A0A1T5EPA8_9SPHI|nr:two-component system, OmpR family, phosphate regulon sensor histidine kinase PhoR [Sphingobacterium nematocida]